MSYAYQFDRVPTGPAFEATLRALVEHEHGDRREAEQKSLRGVLHGSMIANGRARRTDGPEVVPDERVAHVPAVFDRHRDSSIAAATVLAYALEDAAFVCVSFGGHVGVPGDELVSVQVTRA